MNKALFFDIDGTLVSFHTHEIPASTIEALTQAKKEGARIFISTGRPPVTTAAWERSKQRLMILSMTLPVLGE